MIFGKENEISSPCAFFLVVKNGHFSQAGGRGGRIFVPLKTRINR